jgi:hypothetical protein
VHLSRPIIDAKITQQETSCWVSVVRRDWLQAAGLKLDEAFVPAKVNVEGNVEFSS